MKIKRAFEIEKQIAKKLGFNRVAGSGSQWYDKEDLKNEKFLAQVKATETKKGNFEVDDISSLERNAIKQNKKPIFIVHFDRQEVINSTWVSMPLKDFIELEGKNGKNKI